MKRILLLLIPILNIACESKECFTPPQSIILNLVNAKNENLIDIKKINFPDIKAIDKSSKASENIRLVDNHYISIENAGWHNGSKHYIFYTPVDTFNLSVTAHKIDSKNCGGHVIDAVELDRESREENGIIKVVLKD